MLIQILKFERESPVRNTVKELFSRPHQDKNFSKAGDPYNTEHLQEFPECICELLVAHVRRALCLSSDNHYGLRKFVCKILAKTHHHSEYWVPLEKRKGFLKKWKIRLLVMLQAKG